MSTATSIARPRGGQPRFGHFPRRWRGELFAPVLAAWLAASLASCSFVVDTQDQCKVDGECKKFGYEYRCQQNVCIGADIACYDPTGLQGGGCYHLEVSACVPDEGATADQIQRACTGSPCTHYEDSAFSGGLPPLPSNPPEQVVAPKLDVPSSTTDCSFFNTPVLYVTGTPAGAVLLSHVSRVVSNDMLIVYVPASSCGALASARDGNLLKGAAWYWDPVFDPSISAARRACNLPAAGVAPDLVVSEVSWQTCKNDSNASLGSWEEWLGPATFSTIAVPRDAQATAISYDAAYRVFGFGASANVVAPWSDGAQIFVDGALSAVIPELATATYWYGSWQVDGAASMTKIAAATDIEKAIGVTDATYLPSDGSVRALPYQPTGMSCGFLPDTSSLATDRKNVIDGRYPLWRPLRFATSKGASADVKTRTAVLESALSGEALPVDLAAIHPEFDAIAIMAEHHFVPTCAMHVTRSEAGVLGQYSPKASCYCHYEAAALGLVTPEAACTACQVDEECASGRRCLHYGSKSSQSYCELAN